MHAVFQVNFVNDMKAFLLFQSPAAQKVPELRKSGYSCEPT